MIICWGTLNGAHQPEREHERARQLHFAHKQYDRLRREGQLVQDAGGADQHVRREAGEQLADDKVKEAQSPAVTKSISAEAWNYSSTPSTTSSPSTYTPTYDTSTGQPPGREGESQSAASAPPPSPPPTPNASTNALAAYTSMMDMVFEGAKSGLAVGQPSKAADPGEQRASRDAIAAYSGVMSLSSVVNLADYFAAPKQANRVVLVAANDSKWPSNGGPGGELPDVRLRQVQGAKPVTLDLPEGSVRDIGLSTGAFIGGAFINVQKMSDVKQHLGVREVVVEVPANEARPGKSGGVGHRQGVALGKTILERKYAQDPTVEVWGELKVETPNGTKQSRYLDVAAVRSTTREIVEGVQVGKLNKSSDVPVARELPAAKDVRNASPATLLNFIGYNR